jgi:hypothetical protein
MQLFSQLQAGTNFAGTIIFCDATWEEKQELEKKAGLDELTSPRKAISTSSKCMLLLHSRLQLLCLFKQRLAGFS